MVLEPDSGSRELEDIKMEFSYLKDILEQGHVKEGMLRGDMYPRGITTKSINARYVYGFLKRKGPKLGRERVGRIREIVDKYVRDSGGIPPDIGEVEDIQSAELPTGSDVPEAFDTTPEEDGNGKLRFNPLSVYTTDQVERMGGLTRGDVSLVRTKMRKREITGYQIAKIFIEDGELRPLWRLGYTGFLPNIIPEVERAEKEFRQHRKAEKKPTSRYKGQ